MRITLPNNTERFGAVDIHEIQQVLELDSGLLSGDEEQAFGWQIVRHVPFDEINEIERGMAIVVPVKGERLKVLEGVISGLPHDCLMILVSNSPREPVDRFAMERDAVEQFCRTVQRQAIIVHQRDPGIGRAFLAAGLPELVGDDGMVHGGKGEGMLLGLALAKLSGRQAVGFVDSDNYVPGAVHEYAKVYAAGIHLARTPFVMVRISWHSKPKIQDGRLFFNRWGRTSQITNRFLNLLLSDVSGFGTEIIRTGNAGEHAMSLDLGLRMRFGSGFSVEPYQYLDLFEQFGGAMPSPDPEVMRRRVEVFQIETRNPHFHEDKGSDHVQEMRLQALNSLYHSPICPDSVKDEIVDFLRQQGSLGPEEEPPEERTYPPLIGIAWDQFLNVLGDEAETFTQVEEFVPRTVLRSAPISISPLEESAPGG